MKTILCFGDSNTFGANPSGGRWGREARWTGLLQDYLGPGYEVVEEGCGGRTTVYDDPPFYGRSGAKTLPVALESHKPIHLLVLMLGTNDCKEQFGADAEEIAGHVAQLAELARSHNYGLTFPGVPEILLVSPIHLGEDVEHSPFVGFAPRGREVSRRLSAAIRVQAERLGCLFLDAATAAGPSPIDQLHMDADGHSALARALAEVIRTHYHP